MKFTTSLLIVIFMVGIVCGKTTKQSAKKDLTSKKILSQIDTTAHSLHSFQALFSQTEVDPVFDELYESSGIFYFNKLIAKDDNKTPVFQIRFDYLKPEESTTIINGGKVIIYTPEMSEPQESYLIDDIKLDAFFAPFVSSKRLRDHYDVVIADEDTKTVTVLLSPKTDLVKKHFNELRITFHKGNWLPTSIYQVKKNGQKITFEFSKIKKNRTISQEMFTKKGITTQRSPRRSRRKRKPKKNPGQ